MWSPNDPGMVPKEVKNLMKIYPKINFSEVEKTFKTIVLSSKIKVSGPSETHFFDSWRHQRKVSKTYHLKNTPKIDLRCKKTKFGPHLGPQTGGELR